MLSAVEGIFDYDMKSKRFLVNWKEDSRESTWEKEGDFMEVPEALRLWQVANYPAGVFVC